MPYFYIASYNSFAPSPRFTPAMLLQVPADIGSRLAVLESRLATLHLTGQLSAVIGNLTNRVTSLERSVRTELVVLSYNQH